MVFRPSIPFYRRLSIDKKKKGQIFFQKLPTHTHVYMPNFIKIVCLANKSFDIQNIIFSSFVVSPVSDVLRLKFFFPLEVLFRRSSKRRRVSRAVLFRSELRVSEILLARLFENEI